MRHGLGYYFKSEKKSQSKLLEYFFNNIVSVLWAFLTSTGALVFILYFISIKYMPELSMSSLLAFFIASSVISIIATLAYLTLVIAPGYSWWFLNINLKTKIHEIDKSGEVDFSDAFSAFTLPLILTSSSFLFSFYFLHVYCSEGSAYIDLSKYQSFISLMLSFTICLLYYIIFNKKYLKKDFFVSMQIATITFFSSLIFIGPLLFLPAIEFLLEDLMQGKVFLPLLKIISNIVLLLFASTVFAYAPTKLKKSRKIYFFHIALALVTTLFVFSLLSQLPKMAVKNLGFGNYKLQFMVLNKDGCIAMKEYGIKTTQKYELEACTLNDVKVLSRLGENYYLSKDQKVFELPKSHVHSWLKDTKNY